MRLGFVRWVSILAFTSLLVSCTKKEESGPSDTLLTHPLQTVDTASHVSVDSASGLVIDSSQMRTPEHMKLLERFSPLDVVHIYHDYRPLRKANTPKSEIEAFLKSHAITHAELLAILDEGDMRGWSTPQ